MFNHNDFETMYYHIVRLATDIIADYRIGPSLALTNSEY